MKNHENRSFLMNFLLFQQSINTDECQKEVPLRPFSIHVEIGPNRSFMDSPMVLIHSISKHVKTVKNHENHENRSFLMNFHPFSTIYQYGWVSERGPFETLFSTCRNRSKQVLYGLSHGTYTFHLKTCQNSQKP